MSQKTGLITCNPAISLGAEPSGSAARAGRSIGRPEATCRPSGHANHRLVGRESRFLPPHALFLPTGQWIGRSAIS
jgi:hypothetical protein